MVVGCCFGVDVFDLGVDVVDVVVVGEVLVGYV